MDIKDLRMIPGDVQPGEKARYYVWLPEGKDVGAPFREFEAIPLDKAVLARLKAPAEIYLCYDEEDEQNVPQVGKPQEEVNVHQEKPDRVTVDVDSAVMHYRGVDMEGANWLMLVWR